MSIKIALAGNPNCGKTTLFNNLTGSNQYVGNWPGVTVEKKDGVGLLLDQISTGDDLLQSVRRQGVDAGQVLNDDILLALQLAFLFLDGNTGPVADVLVRAGQIVEQGSFTAVRVSGKCNFNCHSFLPPCCTTLMHNYVYAILPAHTVHHLFLQ